MTKKEAKTVEIVEKDFEQCLKLAQLGDVKAQLKVGAYYYSIKRTEDHKEKAFNWFMEAAKQENARAQLIVGLCYSNGKGVEENKKEAFEWYKKAAEHGDEIAQFYVGMYYYKGKNDAEQNFEEAFKWFLKAAEQGHVKAQFNVGCCYNKGEGVTANKKEAFKWFKKAAEQGHVNAQFNVGCCYNKGDGIKANKEEAFKWFIRAAEQGHEKAKSFIERYNNNSKDVKNKKAAKQDNIRIQISGIDSSSNNLTIDDLVSLVLEALKKENEKSDATENHDFSKVFIVHGRDEGLKQKIARLLKDQGIEPIILDEQLNGGAETIIKKFEENSNVGAAICLFTADDIGKLDDKYYNETEKTQNDYKHRARQNVVFETGFFMAKLGRKNVIIIADQEVEFPSDLSGILYTNSGDWYVKMLKELRKMNYKIDLNLL